MYTLKDKLFQNQGNGNSVRKMIFTARGTCEKRQQHCFQHHRNFFVCYHNNTRTAELTVKLLIQAGGLRLMF